MFRKITKRVVHQIKGGRPDDRALDILKVLTGNAIVQQRRASPPTTLAESEFRVFSQFGDDGIIQHVIDQAKPSVDTFVEFGVESYKEANTRFLLVNDNWRGLVLDGSEAQVATIKADRIYWRHDLTAVRAFIDRDNINGLIEGAGVSGPIGLLSIDIDGVDWWVWEYLTCVDPTIVVAEYNGVFGGDRAVTVPYDKTFVRGLAHHSNLYWGCSLRALCVLAERKGLVFVGCNRAGNNAYFVKRGREGNLKVQDPTDGFVEPRFRESRNEDGSLSLLSGQKRLGPIAHLPLWDVEREETIRVGELRS